MSVRELLDGLAEALGPRAWMEQSARWVANVAEDRPAVEEALLRYRARRSKTRDNPVRNPDGWLEAVFRTQVGADCRSSIVDGRLAHVGKAVAA